MKVLVGLSGGFDSTYCAQLLIQDGHAVEGAVLDMHEYTELSEAQCAANSLQIPLHIVSCREAFENTVITDFCREYMRARTPNPCIICNEKVKFRALYDYAMKNGFDKIATGHYAKIVSKNGRVSVGVADDISKDQSYMLYRLPQEILTHLLFPMGNIIKKEAKNAALTNGIFAAERPESQEICFVKNESYTDFLARRCGAVPPGPFVDAEGNRLGMHKGITHYTVGQRKGLGVSGKSRLFIQSIDAKTGQIVLADKMPQVARFTLKEMVYSGFSKEELLRAEKTHVRVRYSAPMLEAKVLERGGEILVELHEKSACAITPGQSAVFYEENRVVCGGIIESVTSCQ